MSMGGEVNQMLALIFFGFLASVLLVGGLCLTSKHNPDLKSLEDL
jgi:glucose uptake protein GlcU